jgi:hypothetical protein
MNERGTPFAGKIPGVGRLFDNRAIDSEFTTGRNFVRAQIIDLREMDQSLLQQAQGRRPYTQPSNLQAAAAPQPAAVAGQAGAQFMTRHVGRRSVMASADAGRSQELAPQSDARRWLALGDRALADGKLELATRYYRQAERVADQALRAPPLGNARRDTPTVSSLWPRRGG